MSKQYRHHDKIKGILLAEGTVPLEQQYVYGWILASRQDAKNGLAHATCPQIYYRGKITSCSYNDQENLLQFQYEDKKVKVTFAKSEGLTAMKETMAALGINPQKL